MTRTTLILATSLLLASAIPATADTFQGNVPNEGIRTVGILNFVPGQAIITLAWTRKAADLDLALECDGIPWGVSASTEERFERLEVGLFSGQTCTLGVISFSGGSKFWVNVQFTGGNTEPLAPGDRSMSIVRVNPGDVPGLIDAAQRIAALKR